MRVSDVQISVRDGRRVAGTLFEPSCELSRAVVLHGATGVPHSFYGRFASWLADKDRAAVLTYDYRNFAAFSIRHPREADATMTNRGVDDQSAALDYLCRRY